MAEAESSGGPEGNAAELRQQNENTSTSDDAGDGDSMADKLANIKIPGDNNEGDNSKIDNNEGDNRKMDSSGGDSGVKGKGENYGKALFMTSTDEVDQENPDLLALKAIAQGDEDKNEAAEYYKVGALCGPESVLQAKQFKKQNLPYLTAMSLLMTFMTSTFLI